MEQNAFITPLENLLINQPNSTLDVFGNQLSHLTIGFETALAQLGSKSGKIDVEVSCYWIGVLTPNHKLNKTTEAKA